MNFRDRGLEGDVARTCASTEETVDCDKNSGGRTTSEHGHLIDRAIEQVAGEFPGLFEFDGWIGSTLTSCQSGSRDNHVGDILIVSEVADNPSSSILGI